VEADYRGSTVERGRGWRIEQRREKLEVHLEGLRRAVEDFRGGREQRVFEEGRRSWRGF